MSGVWVPPGADRGETPGDQFVRECEESLAWMDWKNGQEGGVCTHEITCRNCDDWLDQGTDAVRLIENLIRHTRRVHPEILRGR